MSSGDAGRPTDDDALAGAEESQEPTPAEDEVESLDDVESEESVTAESSLASDEIEEELDSSESGEGAEEESATELAVERELEGEEPSVEEVVETTRLEGPEDEEAEEDPAEEDELVAEESDEELSGDESGEDEEAEEYEDEDEDEEEEEYEDEEEAAEAEVPGDNKQWYVLKVQSNREDSIRDAILRRVKMANLEEHLGEIVVPTEKVSEIKAGKKRVMERKFFPGYIMVNVDLNHDIWFVIRETPGVGDFVGANNQPVPMSREDVDKMLGREAATEVAQPRLKINFDKGDRVKIKEGTFENFEGDVEEVIEAKGVVRVMIQIFGRPTPVELEYWQVEPV